MSRRRHFALALLGAAALASGCSTLPEAPPAPPGAGTIQPEATPEEGLGGAIVREEFGWGDPEDGDTRCPAPTPSEPADPSTDIAYLCMYVGEPVPEGE
ncbi:hypothetical protein [Streptomyces litchfieldiae]|uniref:Lipoprotein n=1 Tax=Streptomyces litchfieldiae TaxID=3075543 RepID=A0ABU2MX87_9ACTN|nr:hypothetical protein [Streptomyces sp. DSM 44938]MDT0346230.1 hypothetical protein [Streptomyces sp. DSM 44938]